MIQLLYAGVLSCIHLLAAKYAASPSVSTGLSALHSSIWVLLISLQTVPCVSHATAHVAHKGQFDGTSNQPHSRISCVTTPVQDLHIRLLHLRDCLRPASQTTDETVGLHNQRISAQIVRYRLKEAHLLARLAHQGLHLTAVWRCNQLQWANARL